MGRKITDLLSSAPSDAKVVRSIDPHKFSLTGDEDFEWRRNCHESGDTSTGADY